MTFGEYVRARCLTLASTDLRRGMRVIDVAMKYGYESPDSFARAFAHFHGATPTDARRPGTRLNACARLILKLIVEGGTVLDYRIENREECILLGFRRHFEGAPDGPSRTRQIASSKSGSPSNVKNSQSKEPGGICPAFCAYEWVTRLKKTAR